MTAYDAFLNNNERSKIQQMFEKWNQTLQPANILSALFMEDIIRQRERQEYTAKQTEYAKNEYLFDCALLRATYSQVQKVRKILVESDVSAHMLLAKMLPVRANDTFWDDHEIMTGQRPGQPDYRESHDNQYRGNQLQYQTQHSRPQQQPMDTDHTQAQDTQNEDVPSRIQNRMENYATNACNSDQVGQNMAKITATSQQGSRSPGIKSYETRSNGPAKGYCLIIANYTNDGGVCEHYRHDIAALRRFFGNVLHFDIKIITDQTKVEIIKELITTQEILNSCTYDRFFCFLLSHGDKKGIKSCRPDGKTDEYIFNEGRVKRDANGIPMCEHISVDEIVKMFTHNQIIALNRFPKVFFVQACSGEKIAYAAGGDCNTATRNEPGLAQPAGPTAEKITIGADLLVCYACQEDHLAWVDTNGSWLIQELVDVLQRYHTTEHLMDMLAEVNDRISHKTMKGSVNIQGQPTHTARQIPDIRFNLTKKLYL